MMSDDAHLGLDVDSSSVAKAAIDLDHLAQSAVRAGQGVDFMTESARVQSTLWNENLQAIESNIAALQRQLAAETAAGEGADRMNGHLGQQTQQMHNLRFATANVAAQFQDILVTSQMGQSPFTIALQQGTQLSQVMQMMAGEGGSGGILATLRASFMSLISPVSLATIGFVAAGAAAIEWLGSIGGKAKSADDALKEHQKVIKDIEATWDNAKASLDAYIVKNNSLLDAQAHRDVTNLQDQLKKASEEFLGSAQSDVLSGTLKLASRPDFLPFTDELEALHKQVVAGKPDFDAFFAAIDKGVQVNPSYKDIGDKLKADAAAAYDLALALGQAGRAVEITGGKYAKVMSDFGILKDPKYTDPDAQFSIDNGAEATKAATAHKIELDAINAKTPAQLADIARRREMLQLDDDKITGTLRQQKIDAAGSEAYLSATHAIVEADRSRLRAVNDNVASAQAELDVVGKTVRETASLQFLRQQMQSAEDEAAQRHGTVSPDVKKAIEDAADAYGALQEKIQGAQTTLADLSPWDDLQQKLKETNQELADNAISWGTWATEVGKSVESAAGKYGDIANNLLGSWSTFNDSMDSMGQERLANERDNLAAQNLSGQAAVDAQNKLNADIEAEGQRSFNAQKELAIARAVVAGAEAVVHAYNAGAQLPGGPITGAIFAGIAAAAVATQIAAIASSTYHSSSISSPISSASTDGTGSSPAVSSGGSLNIVISGSGNVSADDFAKQLADGLADGAHPELAYQISVARAAA